MTNLSDQQVQERIMHRLRSLIGGPKSLRFSPGLLCEGLCVFAGRSAALTLRSVEDCMTLLRAEFARAAVLPLQQGDDRCDGGSADEVSVFLTVGLASLPHRTPTNLVLSAALSVLAQLSKAHGMQVDQLQELMEAAHRSVPTAAIDEFQTRAAKTRAN